MRLFGRIENAPKRYLQGTHRTRSPEETLRTYSPLMERCGITRLANVTGLDFVGIPVYAAIRPLSRSLSVAQGKGADDASAKASALMESLECWHAENPTLPLRYETPRALRRAGDVLDTSAITPRPGTRLDLDRPMLFAEGWEIFAEAPIFVPFDLVHVNFVAPLAPCSIYSPNSNGLASGNCLVEAAVHALCELIERDATSLWFLDPEEDSDTRSLLELDTVDEYNRALIARIDAAGLLLGAFDTTADTGIPSYQAILVDRPGSERAMGYFWGFGCHLDPGVALSRAVTEAVQCRLTEISGAREDITPASYQQNRDDAELENLQALLIEARPQRRLSDRPSLATDSLAGDLEVLRDGLRRAGIRQGALVDLSRPDIGLPVVRAVVPELEGFFEGNRHRPGPRGRKKAGS
jgi:YcaO-like protein with predicted kinase domain